MGKTEQLIWQKKSITCKELLQINKTKATTCREMGQVIDR